MGNIYTGSLYTGILSLVINPNINLVNKRLMMFSYGSGCAATLFVLRVKNSSIGELTDRNKDVMYRLNERIKVSPQDYDNVMSNKEKLYNSNNYTPQDKIENLFENTFYLEKVDERWRRYYSKYSVKGKSPIHFNKLSSNSLAVRRLSVIRNHIKASLTENSNLNEYASLPMKAVFDNNVWSGFYKKSIYEKIHHVIFP
jgi:hydroxymethylglutaryl-CoA synthase